MGFPPGEIRAVRTLIFGGRFFQYLFQTAGLHTVPNRRVDPKVLEGVD